MQIDLLPAELLSAVHDSLNRRFFETTRNDAKQLYVTVRDGRVIPFMAIVIADKGEINCSLALDHSEFVGKLNFTFLRKALASQLQRIADKLSKQEDLNMYTNETNGDKVFNIPELVETDLTVNILVMGIEQRQAGSLASYGHVYRMILGSGVSLIEKRFSTDSASILKPVRSETDISIYWRFPTGRGTAFVALGAEIG